MAESLGISMNQGAARQPSRTARLFVVGILGAEVVGWLFFSSDMLRALMVVCVLAPCYLVLIVGSRLTIPAVLIRANVGIIAGTVAYAAIGMYGATLGFLNHNGAYYVLADVYHWYGEGVLVAAMTVAMLHGMTSRYLMGLVSLAGLLLGLLALAGAIAGTFGLHLAGGHLISYLHIWRLEAGRGFPAAHLAFVTAIVSKGNPNGLVKLTSRLALLVLLAALFVTFKRSQWLTYMCLFVGILAPPRWQGLIRGLAVVVVGFAFALMLSIPGGFEKGKDEVLELLTYNPSYNTEDALDSRATQMEAVVPWVLKRPLGYGFGAKIYVYTPSVNEPTETHYIHNTYMYYAVQLGIPVTLLGLLLLAALLVALWLRFGLDPEWDWLVHGSFASLVTLSVISLALVCYHTPYLGFSVGAAVLAIQHVPLRGTVAARTNVLRKRRSERRAAS